MNGKMTRWATGVVAVLVVLGAATAWGAIKTDTPEVTFRTLDEVKTVNLMKANGQPVAKNEVKDIKLIASGHNYIHMLGASVDKGRLTLTPKVLEVGTYDLVVSTSAGDTKVRVNAPLNALPGHPERIAQERGVSTSDVMREMGLATELPRATYSLELPESYYAGQALSFTMPVQEEAQGIYRWTVNGKVVKQGVGATSIDYTFLEPGDYVVTFSRIQDGVAVSAATDTTTVLENPATAWRVARNTAVSMPGPRGYTNYQWLVDGELVSTDATLDFVFAEPGVHEVQVIASNPSAPLGQQMVKREWRTTVTPEQGRFVITREYDYP